MRVRGAKCRCGVQVQGKRYRKGTRYKVHGTQRFRASFAATAQYTPNAQARWRIQHCTRNPRIATRMCGTLQNRSKNTKQMIESIMERSDFSCGVLGGYMCCMCLFVCVCILEGLQTLGLAIWGDFWVKNNSFNMVW